MKLRELGRYCLSGGGIYSAVASQGRICLKGSPSAGHVAGVKTSFAFFYCHTPQSDIHEFHSTCSLQHTSHNPYWFATTPEVPPPHSEQLRVYSRSVHTAVTAPSKPLLYILQHGSNVPTSLITSNCTY